jgi:putative component of membrane protein insertase Oxa1/YidC/SpoIIIJ protein YidD
MNLHSIPACLSIWCIRTIWHGRIGKWYKYRRHIACPFVPSCSNYTIIALKRHGFLKGWYLAYRRVRRCNRTAERGTIDYP